MLPPGLVIAFTTLSLLPLQVKKTSQSASALPWFPMVGCVLGLLVCGPAYLFSLATAGGWPMGTALIAVAAGVVLTRALHLDGLADWADSFGSIADRQRRLAIMKDSQLGVFGTTALIGVLLVKTAAVARLATHDQLLWIVGAYVISRTMQTELAVRLPYARAEGGTGSPFVSAALPAHRRWAWLAAFALVIIFFGPIALAGLTVGWIIGRTFGWWCSSRLGGVTGDLLGACSELTETGILFCCAAAGDRIAVCSGWQIWL